MKQRGRPAKIKTNIYTPLKEALPIIPDKNYISPIKVELDKLTHKLSTEEVIAMDKARIEGAQKASIGKFSPYDIQLAMNDISDWTDKASLVSVILLGDVAKACHENRVASVDKIELAMSGKALTYEVRSLFESTWKYTKTDYGYTYNFTPPLKWDMKIPVYIYVYKTKLQFFDSPDKHWFGTEGFNIPNPFNKYWEEHEIIDEKLRTSQPLSSQSV